MIAGSPSGGSLSEGSLSSPRGSKGKQLRKAVGITDGYAKADENDPARKALREKYFPNDIVRKALETSMSRILKSFSDTDPVTTQRLLQAISARDFSRGAGQQPCRGKLRHSETIDLGRGELRRGSSDIVVNLDALSLPCEPGGEQQ